MAWQSETSFGQMPHVCRICKSHGLDLLEVVMSLIATSDSRLTLGMYYAVQKALSVGEYIRLGGVWGYKASRRQRPDSWDYVWDSYPTLLWGKVSYIISIPATTLTALLILGTGPDQH